MPKFDIFYGDMLQCRRVKDVIEGARAGKTTDAVIHTQRLLIRTGKQDNFVLAADGPMLDIHDAQYLACFADGVIEADANYSPASSTKPRIILILTAGDRFADIRGDVDMECIVQREEPSQLETEAEHQYFEFGDDFDHRWVELHAKADAWEADPNAPHNMDAAAVLDLLIPEGAKVWDRSNSVDLMAAQAMVITRLTCFACEESVELGAFSLAGTGGSRKFLGEQFDKGWRAVSIEDVIGTNERVYCPKCSQHLPNGGKS